MVSSERGKTLRVASAALGLPSMMMLVACSPAGEPTPAPTSAAASQPGTSGADAVGGTKYADGTYSADGSYLPPRGNPETITVTVTLEHDIVQDVTVTGTPDEQESVFYQGQFIDGISAVVVGKNIDELNVSVVSGSSLTSGGFNAAIEAIKQDAAAG